MKRPEIRMYENKCTQNYPPVCNTMCPMHVDVKKIMECAAKGDFESSAKAFQKSIPFPRIVSRICDHPCEKYCKRIEKGGSILISKIERACIDYAKVKSKVIKPFRKLNKKIAIVGGGLSGLTAALLLYEKGYDIHIYEKTNRLGGNIWDCSELPVEYIEQDLEIFFNTEIQIHFNCDVGNNIMIDELKRDFDGVYGSITDYPEFEHTFGNESFIQKICNGRTSAITLDREVKKVSLTEGRENEGAYQTSLFVNMDAVEEAFPINLKHKSDGLTKEEAQSEAKRCIQCECMECVKICKFLDKYGGYPKTYVREIANNVNILMGVRQTKNLVNSCTFCGLCGEVCPNGLNMRDVCYSGKVGLVNKNAMPETIHDFPINDMLFSNSEHFELIKNQPGTEKSKYMFFPGCQLAALEPIYVEKAYKYLTKKLEGGVGLYLRCCGAPAEWAGRVELFNETIETFKQAWEKAGKPILITACSSCSKIFKDEIDGLELTSIWEIYDKYGVDQSESLSTCQNKTIAVHDACTARHDDKVQSSVRNILAKKGYKIEELEYSRSHTKCCGYGGLVSFANKPLAEEMIQSRINETDKEFIVYCAMCKDNFTSEGKPTLHMFDVIYDNQGTDRKVSEKARLTFSKRQENRVKLKQKLLKEFWDIDMKREKEPYEQIKIKLSKETEKIIDDRLILISDIQKVIHNAETMDKKIFNPKNGHYTASLKSSIITYWVEYSIDAEFYIIHKAYSHRLEINKDIKENEHRKYSL